MRREPRPLSRCFERRIKKKKKGKRGEEGGGRGEVAARPCAGVGWCAPGCAGIALPTQPAGRGKKKGKKKEKGKEKRREGTE